jgi:hypothetical protein
VLKKYPTINILEKMLAEACWLFSAAWLYSNNIRNEQTKLWPEEWQRFKKQRVEMYLSGCWI